MKRDQAICGQGCAAGCMSVPEYDGDSLADTISKSWKILTNDVLWTFSLSGYICEAESTFKFQSILIHFYMMNGYS